jgi:hypothetical protein
MKKVIQSFNWRNFALRTIVFFVVFLIIQILADWIENSFSIRQILNQKLFRFLLFAMIIAILDNETWLRNEPTSKKDPEPEFKTQKAFILHYLGVAFFISLLCGLIFTFFVLISWLIHQFRNTDKAFQFSGWNKYLLIIAAIGICFALFDAIRHLYRNKEKA